jgi:site-specific DNA recombinase
VPVRHRVLGIDTGAHGSHLHVGMKLLIANAHLRDLADKTRRGMLGRAHAGLSTGLLPFGYRSEPSAQGHRVLNDEERAAVVRRIFTEFAGGRGLASIATVLNAEDTPPPRGNGRRGRPGWVATGVRAILLNEKYAGRWAFNAREYVRPPGSKNSISRPRLSSEVVVHEHPERRIVSADLWEAVQERFAINGERYGVEKRANRSSLGRADRPSSYLLSGLLVCADCGAPMTISGGAADRRYY